MSKDKKTSSHGTGRPQAVPNNMVNGRMKTRKEIGAPIIESEDTPISDHDLKQLLIKIARADLADGADIFDHPCSVAVRRIESLTK